LRDCLNVREVKQPDAWNTFNTRSMLGEALVGLKQYEAAEPLLVQGTIVSGADDRGTTLCLPECQLLPQNTEEFNSKSQGYF
jgi:hypothetical protein